MEQTLYYNYYTGAVDDSNAQSNGGISRLVNNTLNGSNRVPINTGSATQGFIASIGADIASIGADIRALIQANEVRRTTRIAQSRQPTSVPLPDFHLTEEDLKQLDPRPAPPNVSALPTLSEEKLGYSFQIQDPQLKPSLQHLYSQFYQVDTPGLKQERIKSIGMSSVQLSDQAFAANNLVEGAFFLDVAEVMMDLLIGLDPVTGLGRDLFELITGRNLVTGETLSEIERGLAFVGVASFGAVSMVKNVGQRVLRISKAAGQSSRALQNTVANASAMVFESRKRGLNFEQWAKKHWTQRGLDVQEQITLRHRSGTGARIDFSIRNPDTGEIILAEVKSGPSAHLSKGQNLFFTTRIDDWEVRTDKLAGLGLKKGDYLPSSTKKKIVWE